MLCKILTSEQTHFRSVEEFYSRRVARKDKTERRIRGGAKSLKYVFDEDKHLSTKDCGNKGLCGTYWATNVRLNHLAFSTRKAIRLAFHDCIPYKDGSGGCDGCINFEDEHG